LQHAGHKRELHRERNLHPNDRRRCERSHHHHRQRANSPQIVSLTGTGEAPITFAPTTLAFGTVAVGNSSTKTLTITNNQNKT